MSKKAIIIPALLCCALLVLFSCTKKDNPFSPARTGFNNAEAMNISLIAARDPGADGTIQDTEPSTGEIEGEISIWFTDFMDASTVTMSNIVVKDTTNNQSISNASLTYYPETRRAVFRGTFSDDAAIIVTLTSSLRNSAGIHLDGNGNELLDGSPYDDIRYRLRTGSAFLDTFDFVHPEISGTDPGITNGVALDPLISVQFSPADVDTDDLVLGNFRLVKTSNQVAVTCSLVSRSPGMIEFQPTDSIDDATQYTVTVTCSNIYDEDGNVLLGMQGENDGWIASIPDYSWDFVTVAQSGEDGTPPSVNSVNVGTNELLVRFNDYMVTSGFTTDNIRVFNNTTGQNLPGSILVDMDERGFRYTLENAVSGTTYCLWVSRMVREQSPGDWYLDGNNNGVGGEWDDDHTEIFTP
jgi:hypothetical protein